MAAPVLSYEGLGLVQGSGWLFRDLDLYIGARDRLALIGRNGAGKTTLLQLLAGRIDSDEGRRTIVPGTRRRAARAGPPSRRLRDAARFRARRRGCARRARGRSDRRPARHRPRPRGGDRERAASGAARRSPARWRRSPTCCCSTSRPTISTSPRSNGSRTWLSRFTGAFVAISHDRTFLTRLTRQTLWLDRGAIRRAEIGFGGFEAWTEQVYAEEARNAEKLDAKLKIEEHWLQRGVTGRRRRNQGRLTKLHEMRAERAAMLGPQGTAKLAIGSDDVRTKMVIDAKNVTKRFGDRTIIKRPDAARHARRPDRRGRPQRRGQDHPAQAADRRDRARRRQRAARQDARRGDHRPAAQPDGRPTRRVRDVLADGGDWIEVLGVKKHIIGYLKEFLFDPALADAQDRLALGRRAFAAAARARVRAAFEPAGARRADQRSRPRDARPAAGSDRRL